MGTPSPNPHVDLSRTRKPDDHKIVLSVWRHYVSSDPRIEEVEMDSTRARKLFNEGLKLCDAIDAEHHKRLAGELGKDFGVSVDAVLCALNRSGLKLVEKDPA